MMGAGVNTSEMFEKLESMRAVVTEVNLQFKNPVRSFSSFPPTLFLTSDLMKLGLDNLHPRHECVPHPLSPSSLTNSQCCVVSEFLSLYETERLIQELTTYEIDVHAICVNQLLFPDAGSSSLSLLLLSIELTI